MGGAPAGDPRLFWWPGAMFRLTRRAEYGPGRQLTLVLTPTSDIVYPGGDDQILGYV